jgi:dolichol-phosphate mannosyltransferase
MDCDLEDPPEAIPMLSTKADEGFDIVLTRRRNRTASHSRRWGSYVFFSLMRSFSSGYVEPGVGSLSMISSAVAREYLRVADSHSQYLAVLHWLGFAAGYVDIEQAPRFAGTSSYTVPKLISHALDAISYQSVRLLYISIVIGFAFGLLSLIQIIYLIYRKLVHSVGMEGWASIMAVLWFVGGTILVSLGIIGLYLGRVFEQTKGRPAYIIRETTDRECH